MHGSSSPLAGAAAFALMLVAPVFLAAEEAVKVFRDVSPAVVSLDNLEGGGTGILLDATGLILTNAHVVASPLPFTCTVDLQVGGKFQPVTFKKIQVVGVHPVKDMALVRIDLKEHRGRLQPASLARNKASTGQTVYAIGNPSSGGGVTLAKTITSGLLSGVDRVVDQVSYYQVSAPINPGNSGGPLCDRSGQVIGMVTLKFTDVDNVGFAIPLHDLEVREFVPLAKRKSNPERAREYIEAAEEFYARSRAVLRAGGNRETPEYIFFCAMAARGFRMALSEDPSNPGLYYNVGMLLRGLDAHELAAAYLQQAIHLDPWGNTRSDYYRELGLALVNQQKLAEARTAWEEGVAKFPRTGARVWEDLTIFHENETHDHFAAAFCAAVVLHLKDESTRQQVAAELYQKHRGALSAGERTRLDRLVSNMDGELARRQQMADKARGAGKGAVLPEFAKWMEGSSHAAHETASESATVASHRPVAPAAIESPARQRGAPAIELEPPRGAIDLLARIDVKSDSMNGTWRFEEVALISPPTPYATLKIPVDPPAEYDLLMVVERRSNMKEMAIGFVRDARQSAFLLDAMDATTSGVAGFRDGVHRGRVLENNQPAHVAMKVRREGVLVTVDGTQLFFERTGAPFPEAPSDWKAAPKHLFLGSHISRYAFHKLYLVPYAR